MIRKVIELTARIILALIRHEEGLLSMSNVRTRTNNLPLCASFISEIAFVPTATGRSAAKVTTQTA